MQPERHGPDLNTCEVDWKHAWRIIATRFPPIDLFERVSADPAVWEALMDLEQATNPRVRDDIGEIALVPPHRRVGGPNASWVMAPFTHVNPRGSRFSPGNFGVYYCADSLKTAIAETSYHFGRFAAESADPARREDMRVLLGSVRREFHDLNDLPASERARVLDPHDYAASRALGVLRRAAGSDGILYPSVRGAGGACLAAFWPDVVGIPRQERHLQFEWDGARVSRYFDYATERWTDL